MEKSKEIQKVQLKKKQHILIETGLHNRKYIPNEKWQVKKTSISSNRRL